MSVGAPPPLNTDTCSPALGVNLAPVLRSSCGTPPLSGGSHAHLPVSVQDKSLVEIGNLSEPARGSGADRVQKH